MARPKETFKSISQARRFAATAATERKLCKITTASGVVYRAASKAVLTKLRKKYGKALKVYK